MEKKEVITGKDPREKFIGLCLEVFPLIEGIGKAVESIGVKAMASITIGCGGYLDFSIHGSCWRMVKIDRGRPAKVYHEFSEEYQILEGMDLEGAGNQEGKDGGACIAECHGDKCV